MEKSPSNGHKDRNVILLDIDGLRDRVLMEAIESGKTPNLKKLYDRGMKVKKTTTIFPAMTYPAQTSIMTGAWPRRHGVVCNSWLDRKNLKYMDFCKDLKIVTDIYARDMVGLPTLFLPRNHGIGSLNKAIAPGAPSLFKTIGARGLNSTTVFHQFNIGADSWEVPTNWDMIRFALVTKNVLKVDKFEDAMVNRALKVLGNPANLMMFYFSNLDSVSHKNGISTQIQCLAQAVDPAVGRMMDSVVNSGLWDRTFWIVFSDHGQTDVIKDDEHWVSAQDLCAVLEKAFPERGEAFFVKKQPIRDSKFAVVAIEGIFCQVYMRHGQAGWGAPPRMKEDVLAAADALLASTLVPRDQGGIGPSVELVLIKDQSGGYGIYQAEPPFKTPGRLIPLSEFFNGREAEYPDALERIKGFTSPLTADIVILPNHAAGYYMDDHKCSGHHGGLGREDGIVPLLISGPGVRNDPSAAVENARIIDLAPTAASLLGVEMNDADGKVLDVMK